MAYLNSEFKLVKHFIDMFGRNAPIKIDTGIAKHNFMLEDKLKKNGEQDIWEELLVEDIYFIGIEGKRVTKKDIQEFLIDVESRGKMKIFDNGRSYYFEGMTKKDDGSYEFEWGS